MQYKLIAGFAVSSVLALNSLFVPSNVARYESSPITIEENLSTTTPMQEKTEEIEVLNPVLLKVSYCESRGRQFNPDGTVVRGKVNPHDIGLLQINSDYHEATAVKLGYDIYTEQGNIKYANYLYKKQGLNPWNWSRPCWENK